MKHESGLDSSVKNSIGCVGLIQFCPDSGGGSTKTINGKTYNLTELQNNLELQLDAIKEFWSKGERDGKIKNAKDLYIYNFFPVAAGKSDDYVLIKNSLINQELLTYYKKIELVSTFHVSTLNAAFLNPKTRSESLEQYSILQKK